MVEQGHNITTRTASHIPIGIAFSERSPERAELMLVLAEKDCQLREETVRGNLSPMKLVPENTDERTISEQDRDIAVESHGDREPWT